MAEESMATGPSYESLRADADRYMEMVHDGLPPDASRVPDLLRNIENFLVGAYVDAEFKGYWNSDIGDGVSTLMALADAREAMRLLDIEPENGSTGGDERRWCVEHDSPEKGEYGLCEYHAESTVPVGLCRWTNGSTDPDENVGPCARCGHDPACGFASIDGDWLCHDDDHSCYFEDSVDRATNGSCDGGQQ